MISASVSFSPQARLDLIEIGDFIAADNLANAQNFVKKLDLQCQKIGHSPTIYPLREDLCPNLRQCQFGKYMIFFSLSDDKSTVRIERVLHGSRDMDKQFAQQDF